MCHNLALDFASVKFNNGLRALLLTGRIILKFSNIATIITYYIANRNDLSKQTAKVIYELDRENCYVFTY
uniref:Uncharacterized protein n=1 Tax=Glossina palpalis gambiensis TaxID=67801 RepID=A0A1B0B301_9MUSC